ncbi:MAG: nucleoside hydrolase [Phycisphaeraceae bacterium]|nr:nucleoside hydrolase [Phycisphaeraceae bacterium]
MSNAGADPTHPSPIPPFGSGAPLPVVIDTDTYNEVDDQFAVTYAMLRSDRIDLQACYAAPFQNKRSQSPADGMQRSYQELLTVYQHMGRPSEGHVFRGSDAWMKDTGKPIKSEAVRDLIDRAMKRDPRKDGPLYVVCIAALTNLASALRIEPRINEHIVVIWLGGHPLNWPTAREFNLEQDLASTRTVLECKAPFVYVPCKNVAEHLRTSLPELAAHVRGCGAIGEYLYESVREYLGEKPGLSRSIWDVAAVAVLLEPALVPLRAAKLPALRDDMTWDLSRLGRTIHEATDARRDLIFSDLFARLAHVQDAVPAR